MENMASSELDVMETSMMSQSSMVSATGSMSMREKSQLKRRINKEHNSNFRAGYVPVNETYLHKAGIRGRKRILLYACLAVLLLVVLMNTALTAWLMWIYHVTHRGMEPMEFTTSSAGYLVRFLYPARFDSLLLSGVILGSRYNRSLTFSGINSKLVLSTLGMKNESLVEVDKDRVSFYVDDLTLRRSPGGKKFFSLRSLKIAQLRNLKNLHADIMQTAQIKNAPNYDNLNIESWYQIQVNGSTGVKSTSKKETEIQANNLHLISRNGSVVLDGRVVLKFTNDLGVPGNDTRGSSRVNVTGSSKVNAKLCVCGRNGRVFAAPLYKPGVSCASVNQEQNLCAA